MKIIYIQGTNKMQFLHFHLTSLLVGILAIGISTCLEVQGGTKIETIKDESGNPLTLNITSKKLDDEEEDVIVVKDADGNNVTTVDVFDGFYIDKPASNNKCMLRPAAGKENKTLCYEETKYEGQNLTDAASEECKGRDIYILKPCDPEKANAAADAAGSNAGRNKRAFFGCRRYYYYTIRRIYYCCWRSLFYCVRRCPRYIYVLAYRYIC